MEFRGEKRAQRGKRAQRQKRAKTARGGRVCPAGKVERFKGRTRRPRSLWHFSAAAGCRREQCADSGHLTRTLSIIHQQKRAAEWPAFMRKNKCRIRRNEGRIDPGARGARGARGPVRARHGSAGEEEAAEAPTQPGSTSKAQRALPGDARCAATARSGAEVAELQVGRRHAARAPRGAARARRGGKEGTRQTDLRRNPSVSKSSRPAL